jgi:hypothetical protein
VPVNALSSFYFSDNVGPGVVRGQIYTGVIEEDAGKRKVLQRWDVSPDHPWQQIGEFTMIQNEIQTLTCSPDNHFVAYWTDTANHQALYLADWKAKRVKRVATLDKDADRRFSIACDNAGRVYWTEQPARQEPSTSICYSDEGELRKIYGYRQVITNQAGTFGVHLNQHSDSFDLQITGLSRANSKWQYSCDLENVFGVDQGIFLSDDTRVGSVVSTDNGEWWGSKISHHGLLAFVLWKSGQTVPYFVYKDQKLKAFFPLGLLQK